MCVLKISINKDLYENKCYCSINKNNTLFYLSDTNIRDEFSNGNF